MTRLYGWGPKSERVVAAAAALAELKAAARYGPDPLRDAARLATRLIQGA